MTPTPEQFEKLRKLACVKGLQPEYQSTFGGAIAAPPEALIAVLRSLGVTLKEDLSDLDSTLAKAAGESFLQLTEPATVAWDGRGAKFPVRTLAHERALRAQLHIKLEGGQPIRLKIDLTRLPIKRRVELDGKSYVERVIALPVTLPIGYHDAVLSLGRRRQRVLIISAPMKAYRDSTIASEKKLCGVFSPLYSIHTKRSWGIGDFRDLGEFVYWATEAGCDFVGTLPLYSGFVDRPIEEPSPYSPVSRLFWNEIFVDPRLSTEWLESPKARKLAESRSFCREVERLQKSKLVDYRGVARLKRKVFEVLADEFFARGREQTRGFRAFLKAKPLTESYAEFRAVCEKQNKMWQEWPERLRDGRIKSGDYNVAAKRYHLYVQWLAHTQLMGLSKRSRCGGLGIYLDFPLSVHAGGFDTWKERESFGTRAAAGAPPDTTHTTGQDWGILPLHPENSRRTGYRYFRACLENQMQYCGVLRLDHVMSLYRLYWVPAGLGAKNGVYVRYNCEEMFAILTLESHRHQCMLIGEDLGTVPPEVREQMTKHEILRMYVQSRSVKNDPKQPLNPEPPNSIAGLNTHDMPPFASFWRYLDLIDKVELGHLDRKKLDEKIKSRQQMQRQVVALLKREKFLRAVKGVGKSEEELARILMASLVRLARGPAKAMIVNIEDLWLEVNPQNVPATWKERPNWRRKLRFSLEDLFEADRYFSMLRRVVAERQTG